MKKKIHSEIDLIHKLSDKMTADELQQYYSSRFENDLLYFKRVVLEQKERVDSLKSFSPLQPLLERVNHFFKDLVSDGYIITDLSFNKNRSKEFYVLSQQREEAVQILHELSKGKEKSHKELFRKWNRLYVILYETVLDSNIISLAQKISETKVTSKSKVLDILKSYRQAEYTDIFECIVPQIRNSIQHRDFVIAPVKLEITFNDRNKPPLTLDTNEYYAKLTKLLDLSMAFDVVTFYLEYPILKVLLENVDIVYNFSKRHNVKFKMGKNAPLTLLDWASLIKSQKKRE
jgi:hypothetical protein